MNVYRHHVEESEIDTSDLPGSAPRVEEAEEVGNFLGTDAEFDFVEDLFAINEPATAFFPEAERNNNNPLWLQAKDLSPATVEFLQNLGITKIEATDREDPFLQNDTLYLRKDGNNKKFIDSCIVKLSLLGNEKMTLNFSEPRQVSLDEGTEMILDKLVKLKHRLSPKFDSIDFDSGDTWTLDTKARTLKVGLAPNLSLATITTALQKIERKLVFDDGLKNLEKIGVKLGTALSGSASHIRNKRLNWAPGFANTIGPVVIDRLETAVASLKKAGASVVNVNALDFNDETIEVLEFIAKKAQVMTLRGKRFSLSLDFSDTTIDEDGNVLLGRDILCGGKAGIEKLSKLFQEDEDLSYSGDVAASLLRQQGIAVNFRGQKKTKEELRVLNLIAENETLSLLSKFGIENVKFSLTEGDIRGKTLYSPLDKEDAKAFIKMLDEMMNKHPKRTMVSFEDIACTKRSRCDVSWICAHPEEVAKKVSMIYYYSSESEKTGLTEEGVLYVNTSNKGEDISVESLVAKAGTLDDYHARLQDAYKRPSFGRTDSGISWAEHAQNISIIEEIHKRGLVIGEFVDQISHVDQKAAFVDMLARNDFEAVNALCSLGIVALEQGDHPEMSKVGDKYIYQKGTLPNEGYTERKVGNKYVLKLDFLSVSNIVEVARSEMEKLKRREMEEAIARYDGAAQKNRSNGGPGHVDFGRIPPLFHEPLRRIKLRAWEDYRGGDYAVPSIPPPQGMWEGVPTTTSKVQRLSLDEAFGIGGSREEEAPPVPPDFLDTAAGEVAQEHPAILSEVEQAHAALRDVGIEIGELDNIKSEDYGAYMARLSNPALYLALSRLYVREVSFTSLYATALSLDSTSLKLPTEYSQENIDKLQRALMMLASLKNVANVIINWPAALRLDEMVDEALPFLVQHSDKLPASVRFYDGINVRMTPEDDTLYLPADSTWWSGDHASPHNKEFLARKFGLSGDEPSLPEAYEPLSDAVIREILDEMKRRNAPLVSPVSTTMELDEPEQEVPPPESEALSIVLRTPNQGGTYNRLTHPQGPSDPAPVAHKDATPPLAPVWKKTIIEAPRRNSSIAREPTPLPAPAKKGIWGSFIEGLRDGRGLREETRARRIESDMMQLAEKAVAGLFNKEARAGSLYEVQKVPGGQGLFNVVDEAGAFMNYSLQVTPESNGSYTVVLYDMNLMLDNTWQRVEKKRMTAKKP